MLHHTNYHLPMNITQQNVCELLRSLRTMPEGTGGLNTPFDTVYCYTILKTVHYIEEHNELPAIKQIRRWQAAAIKKAE